MSGTTLWNYYRFYRIICDILYSTWEPLHNQNEEGLEVVVVMEDNSVLMGLIRVQEIEGKMAI